MAYTPASQNPYELWQTRKLLGVFRDIKPEDWYFDQFFTNNMISTTEWIDFEKLPVRSRQLAPFVKPMGRGHGVFTDQSQGFRFKPANIVVEDVVDPLRALSPQPGVDPSMLDMSLLDMDPLTRLNLIKIEMMNEMLLAVRRRWEWMRARSIIDGAVTITYLDGTSVLVDFQRAAGHTATLTSGNRWGDAGVSIVDSIQAVFDTMSNADFGGLPLRITMGGGVANVVRKDTEFLSHMDKFVEGGSIKVVRGLVGGENGNGKIYKIGEMFVGGASGQRIELWVNNETYDVKNPTTGVTTKTRYLGNNEVIFTAAPDVIKGYNCFGMIVDKDAGFKAMPVFPKNYESITGNGRIKVEGVSAESAPLFVPINPNGTYKLTAIA